ncbi:PepSY domain-containing protein [Haliangium sp.]|uniref:PepSY domain-containing protein n=1 Tax=Haliangium sp. TaxID=2663208 RepID=UPI003D1244C8
MSRRFYAWHRWLGLVVGVQLALWTVGGLIFATHDIAWVRGEDGRASERARTLDAGQVRVEPGAALARLGDPERVERVVLRMLLDRPVYEVVHSGGTALIDAVTGDLASPVDRDTAVAIARADRREPPQVAEVTLIEADPPTEYRGGDLPAWRVALADDDDTHIYVAADSGRITARRNDAWRRFDFFWMLHTMDYGGRDDFNHPLLIAAAGLAVVTLGSGFLLWWLRLRRRRRRASASRSSPRA